MRPALTASSTAQRFSTVCEQSRKWQPTAEKRCAVLEAVNAGRIPRARYESYLKLKGESERLAGERQRHAQKERKRQTRVAQREHLKLKLGDLPGSGGHSEK